MGKLFDFLFKNICIDYENFVHLRHVRNLIDSMENLTPQEEEAMLILWRLKKGFVKDILEQYPESRPPYTTLASTIKNLERKQYVEGRRYGNTFEYTPIISEAEYKKQFMSGFVKDYFRNSYSELVAFFAKEQRISADELKEIIRLIENSGTR